MTNEQNAIQRLTRSLKRKGFKEQEALRIIEWFCDQVEDQLCGASLLGNYEVGMFWKKKVKAELKKKKPYLIRSTKPYKAPPVKHHRGMMDWAMDEV
jgi:hypothetical protein